MPQYPARSDAPVGAAAPFSHEMVQGWFPHAPRLPFIAKQGWSDSQTSPVQAAISPEMFKSSSTLRYSTTLHAALIFPGTQVLSPFSPDMAQGWQPAKPTLTRSTKVGWFDAPLTNIVITASPDMVQGSMPPTQRAFVPSHTGWSIAQETPVAAPFSIEMAQGSVPYRHRAFVPSKTGLTVNPLDILPISFEMMLIAQPTSPRLPKFLRDGWATSQTTPVAAPFSNEMSAGSIPDRNRAFHPSNPGWTTIQVDVQPFLMEMLESWAPPRNRAFVAPKTGWISTQTTFNQAPFTDDMIQGSDAGKSRWTASKETWWSGQILDFVTIGQTLPRFVRMADDAASTTTMLDDSVSMTEMR